MCGEDYVFGSSSVSLGSHSAGQNLTSQRTEWKQEDGSFFDYTFWYFCNNTVNHNISKSKHFYEKAALCVFHHRYCWVNSVYLELVLPADNAEMFSALIQWINFLSSFPSSGVYADVWNYFSTCWGLEKCNFPKAACRSFWCFFPFSKTKIVL